MLYEQPYFGGEEAKGEIVSIRSLTLGNGVSPDSHKDSLSGFFQLIGSLKSRGQNSCVLCITVVVQSLSCVRLFVTAWTAACKATLSFTVSWNLLKLTSTESVMLSNHLILMH